MTQLLTDVWTLERVLSILNQEDQLLQALHYHLQLLAMTHIIIILLSIIMYYWLLLCYYLLLIIAVIYCYLLLSIVSYCQ